MFLNAAYYPVQVVDEAGGSKTFSVPSVENQAEHLGLPEADYLDQLNETLKTRLEVDLSRTPYVKAKTEAELRKVRESILGLPMVPAKDAAKLRYHVARRIAKKINSPLHAASFIDLMMSRVGLDLFLSAYWLLRSDQKHLESVHLRHLFATCYCAILWIIEQNRDYLAEYLICLLTEAIFTSDPDPDLAAINARNHEIAFNIAENFVRRYLLGLPTPKVTMLTGCIRERSRNLKPKAMINLQGISPLQDHFMDYYKRTEATAPSHMAPYSMPELKFYKRPRLNLAAF